MARDLRPHLAGATLVRVRVFRPDVLRATSATRFARRLRGRAVRTVDRRAKHLVFGLDDGWRVVVQPRMTGSFLLARDGAPRDPYSVFEATLATGATLRYRDVRRLGAVYLLSPREWERYCAALGPEPLDPAFTPDVLARAVSSGRLAVKKAIMDQRRLAGVGNIYASEALWLARIDPSRQARRLTRSEIRALHAAVVTVLRRAVRGRGTTVRDYRTGTGGTGTYQRRLRVYGRAGKPCPRCGERIAATHAIDGRATYFCARCQR